MHNVSSECCFGLNSVKWCLTNFTCIFYRVPTIKKTLASGKKHLIKNQSSVLTMNKTEEKMLTEYIRLHFKKHYQVNGEQEIRFIFCTSLKEIFCTLTCFLRF